MTVEDLFKMVDEENQLSEYSESSSSDEDEPQVQVENFARLISPRTNFSSLANDQPPTKKQKVPETKVGEFLQAAVDNMKNSLQTQNPELYHLTNVWAYKLLKLSPSARSIIEQQISEILYKAPLIEELETREELSSSTSSDCSPSSSTSSDCSPSSSIRRIVPPSTSKSSESVANDSVNLSTN